MGHEKFFNVWERFHGAGLLHAVETLERTTSSQALAALQRIPVSSDGFLALIAPSAQGVINQIEKSARKLTAQRFGHTVNLYIPLYLSNACVNSCLYCHYGQGAPSREKTLSLDELKAEGEKILESGYKNILLVAGESKKNAPLSLIENSVRTLKDLGFAFVSIETQVFDTDAYKKLGDAGLDGVTVYQETYDPDIYSRVHPSGPKKDFKWRMSAPERVAEAGIRSIGMGFLLGLGDWRKEAVSLMTHVKFIQKKFWQTSVSISFPRLHDAPDRFGAINRPTDEELIRLIFATRLANPDSLLTLSTREGPKLRDRLFGAGINQVSAGSKTSPGAYSVVDPENQADEQFPVVDDRSPEEVVKAIRAKGLDQVWKDWDINLKPVA